MSVLLECVINLSEGRRIDIVEAIAAAGGAAMLDRHSDAVHNRTVLTVGGTVDVVDDAARRVAGEGVLRLDLGDHEGVHPRIGVVDVVPFVPLAGATLDDAVAARNRFAAWAGDALRLPCFLYGPERTLPSIRKEAFRTLVPDTGPPQPHPSAGACAVGARAPLVAYNLWLADGDVGVASRIAAGLRSAHVRALGLAVGPHGQVSCNLIDPDVVGPAEVYDAVAARVRVARAELVGLVPESVLARTVQHRWSQLDLTPDRTIEARLRSGFSR
jgi:glutamate formiminotransferase